VRIPISLIGLVASTLFIWLLASIPVVNFILLFVLLPIWPALTINGGMIAMTFEVFGRKLSLGWLALPFLWLGGYVAFAWANHEALGSLRKQFAEANGQVHVPFDPARQNLFSEKDSEDSLIQNYGLPVAYVKDGGDPNAYRSTRMVAQEVCEQLRDPAFSGAGIWPHWFHEPSDKIGGGTFVTSFCMVSMPDTPSLPLVELSVNERRDTYGPLKVTYQDTTIATPDGKAYLVRGGHASALGWIPLPIIEYDPMSSSSKKMPKLGFWRSSFLPLNTEAGRFTSGTAALANALGLKKVAPEERKALPSEAVQAKIIASQRAVVADETAKLDRALSDVQSEIGSVPFNSLRGRQDIILPRITAIVTAVERGVAEQRNGRNNAQQMFHLLEQVQPDAVTPYLTRIKALEAKDKWFKFESKPVAVEEK
jgi:hypothetical protein